MNGPLPMVRFETSPSASTTSFGRIQKIGAPIEASNGANASFSLNSTTFSLGALTSATISNVVFCGETFMKCLNDQTTSSAVTGRPFSRLRGRGLLTERGQERHAEASKPGQFEHPAAGHSSPRSPGIRGDSVVGTVGHCTPSLVG